MPTLRIVAFTLAAVLSFGLLQALVSVSVCPEFFTLGEEGSDPMVAAFLRGLQGGVGGLVLGLALAVTCRAGDGPKLSAGDVLPGLLWLLGTLALTSLGAGVGTWWMGSSAEVRMRSLWGQGIAPELHVVFLAVSVAYLAAYLALLLGGIALCGWAGVRRYLLERGTAP